MFCNSCELSTSELQKEGQCGWSRVKEVRLKGDEVTELGREFCF